MASRPDSHILLVTKQRQSRETEAIKQRQSREIETIGEAGSSSSAAAAVVSIDEREPLDSEEEDDPELKEAVARSLTDTGELTQEEILKVIKKEAKSRVKQEVKVEQPDGEGDDLELGDDQTHGEEDGDDIEVLLLPDATVLLSSRLGGRAASPTEVKQEPIELDDEEEIPMGEHSDLEDVDKKDSVSVGVMSESDSDSDSDLVSVKSSESIKNEVGPDSLKVEEDDLFADVFAGDESIDRLTSIVEKARVPLNDSSTAKAPLLLDSSSEERKRLSNVFIEDPIVLNVPPKTIQDSSSKVFAFPKNTSKRVEGPAGEAINENPLVDGILESVNRLGKTRDIFAGIAATAKRLQKPQSQGEEEAEKVMASRSNGKEVEEDTEFRKQVTESLKSSSSLTMKILSRGAEEELTKAVTADSNKCKEKKTVQGMEGVGGLLVNEQERLVKEMQEVEEKKKTASREERLLRFTAAHVEGKARLEIGGKHKSGEKQGSKKMSAEEERVLVELGVTSEENSAIQKRLVGEEEELERQKAPATVFSSSAPGFVHSEKDGARVEVMEEGGMDDEDQMLLNLSQEAGGGEGLLSENELVALQCRLAEEQSSLVAERGKAERVAASLTDQMYAECQELLQLFGLPWLVAPTEAEAQCAFLDSEGLTQGTITDDSDIWLFGGKKVFRNFFNQEKLVTAYTATELVEHFGLNRERLVLLAMLTGSDYTMGIQDVGPVTALEVLAEFPGENLTPLNDFKTWWSRVKGEGLPVAVGNKTREKLKRLHLPPSFPSEAVADAYLKPTVDECREKFSWAVPNLVAARDFARERLGFDSKQVDQLLTPVIRSLAQRKSNQARIDSYFSSWRTVLPEGGRLGGSKRVEEALKKVRGGEVEESSSKTVEKAAKKTSRVVKRVKRPIEIEDDPRKKVSLEREKNEAKKEVSLIGKSCGFVISASSEDVILQREQREREAKEAKAKAVALFKKSQEAKQQKMKKKFKRPARLVKPDHGLSESDSD